MLELKKELDNLKEKGLFRRWRCVETAQAERVVVAGKEVINLCSNNYLGFANCKLLKQAAVEATLKYGVSASASRLISGTMKLHEQLEQRLAEFKGAEAALLFNTGYMANTGIIAALVGRGDTVFCDRLNHASIIDGAILSRAEFKRYAHRDTNALRKLLEQSSGYKKKLIVTDSVFSMDGDIAPLPGIVALAEEFDCMVMVDEAHATGVLGDRGRGAVEHFGLESRVDIQMGTLGKALGGFGAFVAGSKELVDYLLNKSRSFIYTTALPPSCLASAIAVLELIERERERRISLREKADFFRCALAKSGFNTLSSETQIIPVFVGSSELTVRFSNMLFEEGVFIQAIRPPSVPAGEARLRITVMATHSQDDLEKALRAIEKTGKCLGLI